MSEPNNATKNIKSSKKNYLQRSRAITAVAIFASLAIILHLSPIKIPAPYAPFLIYELWEIPIFAAFYLYGARISLAVAFINFLSLLVLFPGMLPSGPIYNLIAISATILGLLIVSHITGSVSRFQRSFWPFSLTILVAPSIRVLVMTIVNATMLPVSAPLGLNMPFEVVIAILPLIGFFNASVAIYSIVIARIIIRTISATTRISLRYGV